MLAPHAGARAALPAACRRTLARGCRRSGARAARTRCAASAHPDAGAFEALVAACGAETSLAVGEGPLGRGVFATAAHREGDTLLRVPLRHALIVTTGGSRETVENLVKLAREYAPPAEGALGRGGVPRALEDHLLDRKRPAADRLAAWLLWAVRVAPVWRLGARLLPQPSFRVPLGERDAPAAHAAYAAVAKADASLAVSVDDFAWALSCVASRTFGADAWTRGDRDGVLGVMMPLADLLNHRFNPNCEFRLRNEAAVFEVFARRPLKPGDEAVISYGESLTNSELRDRYGFDLGAGNHNGEEPPKKRDPYASLAPAPQ